MTGENSLAQEPQEGDSAAHWRPIARTRAHELVVDQVEEQIAAGALRVGDRLPAERELSTRLGVSRAAVREAMRTLEAIGVLQAGAGRDAGTVLAAMPSEALTQLLRIHIALANFPMSDVIEARVLLECWSARLAARSATPEARHGLRDLAKALTAPLAPADYNELDTRFHVDLARAGGNVLVADLTTAIRESMRTPILESFTAVEDWGAVVAALNEGHTAIAAAVLDGDEDRAADLVEEHIRFAYGALGWTKPQPPA